MSKVKVFEPDSDFDIKIAHFNDDFVLQDSIDGSIVLDLLNGDFPEFHNRKKAFLFIFTSITYAKNLENHPYFLRIKGISSKLLTTSHNNSIDLQPYALFEKAKMLKDVIKAKYGSQRGNLDNNSQTFFLTIAFQIASACYVIFKNELQILSFCIDDIYFEEKKDEVKLFNYHKIVDLEDVYNDEKNCLVDYSNIIQEILDIPGFQIEVLDEIIDKCRKDKNDDGSINSFGDLIYIFKGIFGNNAHEEVSLKYIGSGQHKYYAVNEYNDLLSMESTFTGNVDKSKFVKNEFKDPKYGDNFYNFCVTVEVFKKLYREPMIKIIGKAKNLSFAGKQKGKNIINFSLTIDSYGSINFKYDANKLDLMQIDIDKTAAASPQ